MEQSLGFILI